MTAFILHTVFQIRQGGFKKYSIRNSTNLSHGIIAWTKIDLPVHLLFCWLDKYFVLSHLWTRKMNRGNIIQFIMFPKDLVRFALISGSSVRETLRSWREKNCLSTLNWEPHTQWNRHSSYVNLLHPKFIFQNQSVIILIGPRFMIAVLAHTHRVSKWSHKLYR